MDMGKGRIRGKERREERGINYLGAGNTLVGGRCGRLFGIGLGESPGSIVRWRGGVDVGRGRLCRRCTLLLCTWGAEISTVSRYGRIREAYPMFKLCNRAWALAGQRLYTMTTRVVHLRRANILPRASDASSLNPAYRIETLFPRMLNHILELDD